MIRIKFFRIIGYIWKTQILFLLNKKIILLKNIDFCDEKINFINSNHIYNLDFYILLYIFIKKNIDSHCWSSLSSDEGIYLLDKVILNNVSSCLINKKFFEKSIRNSIKLWENSEYNRYVIIFFGRLSQCDI